MAQKVDKYDNGHRCYECIHCTAVVCGGKLIVCNAQRSNNPPKNGMEYSIFPRERHGCMQFWEQPEECRPTALDSAIVERQILKGLPQFHFGDWDGMKFAAAEPKWVEAFKKQHKEKS